MCVFVEPTSYKTIWWTWAREVVLTCGLTEIEPSTDVNELWPMLRFRSALTDDRDLEKTEWLKHFDDSELGGIDSKIFYFDGYVEKTNPLNYWKYQQKHELVIVN